jgi:hypothetical protein
MTSRAESESSDADVLVWNGMIVSVPGRPPEELREAEARGESRPSLPQSDAGLPQLPSRSPLSPSKM